jgi:hypothetical protein
MLKRFTFWLTLLSVIVVLVHVVGLDREHLLFLQVNVPAWFIALFVDLHAVNVYLLYALNILFWFLTGVLADRIVNRKTRETRA